VCGRFGDQLAQFIGFSDALKIMNKPDGSNIILIFLKKTFILLSGAFSCNASQIAILFAAKLKNRLGTAGVSRLDASLLLSTKADEYLDANSTDFTC
jgi:hypothetical protein